MKARKTVRTKIVEFLTRNREKSFTAKGIAKAAKLNYNTVRKELGYLTLRFSNVTYGIKTKNNYTTYTSRAVI